ncbi:MAG TPA: glycosyltransferase family A protein [Chitinispirillaceae bacterium]|nr:glycosyltransferase family A protein [Chitinispirillaceae bacterium]
MAEFCNYLYLKIFIIENIKKMLKLSVVVASHRIKWINELSELLLSQKGIDRSEFEIIIVTDYQNDTLSEKYPGIKWIFYPDLSISKKRNEGIGNANGIYVAFTDDDCMPSLTWAADGVTYLDNNPGIAGVEGYTTIDSAGESRVLIEYRRLEKQGFRTNNIFYRKSDLVAAGLFDTRFSVQREDVDLAFSLLSLGKKIEYCKNITLGHRFRDGEPWDLLKNCINRRFDPLLYKKHPELYRQYIKSPFPLSILLSSVIFLPLLLLIAGLFSFRRAVLISTVAALLFTLHRTGIKPVAVSSLVKEMVSVVAAPVALTAALLYGSIKYKKVLLL